MDTGFGGFDEAFFVMFALATTLILGVFAAMVIKGSAQWMRNNRSPVTTAPAVVVTKRGETWGGTGDSSASTSYYVTFEVEGGTRIGVGVTGTEYGQLAEGDRGLLTYQGTRYKGFERSTSRTF